MAQVLVATKRILLNYVSDGLPHKQHTYVSGSGVIVGGSMQLDTTLAADSIDWTDAAASMAGAVAALLPATGQTGQAILQERTGLVWNPIDTFMTNVAGAGGFSPASQVTIVMNDTAFKKVKFIVLDTKVTPPYHYATLPTPNISLNAAANEFTAASSLVPAPHIFVKSRGDRFLKFSPIVGITGDLNDKIRRARGLT